MMEKSRDTPTWKLDFLKSFWVYNHSQDIWNKFCFPCEIVHYRKSLISVFEEFFVKIDKVFILAASLGTGLPFYEV